MQDKPDARENSTLLIDAPLPLCYASRIASRICLA
jgi:hypothetical protein